MTPWRAHALAVPVLCCLAAAACRPAIDAGEPSIEALARSVLDAFEARDVERLAALAIDEREFHAVVWPDLPASRPERNLDADFVWTDLRVRSSAARHRALLVHGGRRYELVRVRVAGATTQHRHYLVHRKTVLEVRHAGGGEEVRLFGSVLEQDGRFKVFSYNID
jgi:hypothetical protein